MYILDDGKHTPHRTCRKPSPKLATSLRCCLGSCFWRHWAAPRISWNFGGKDFPAGSESYSMCRMSLPSALIIYSQFLEDRLCCGVQSTVNYALKSLICDSCSYFALAGRDIFVRVLHTVQQCLNKWETIQRGKDFCQVSTTLYPHIRNQPNQRKMNPVLLCMNCRVFVKRMWDEVTFNASAWVT